MVSGRTRVIIRLHCTPQLKINRIIPVARFRVTEKHCWLGDCLVYIYGMILEFPFKSIFGIEYSPLARLIESICFIPFCFFISAKERNYATPLPQQTPCLLTVGRICAERTKVTIHEDLSVFIFHCLRNFRTPNMPYPDDFSRCIESCQNDAPSLTCCIEKHALSVERNIFQ